MAEHDPTALTIEWTLGLCASRGSETVDVAAGAREGLLVVSDGPGGHGTGWLGARLTVRGLLARGSTSAAEARFVGAADGAPDLARWTGGVARAADIEYEKHAADAGDRAARELASLFADIDRELAGPPKHSPASLLAGCTATRLDGARVLGAHVGIGRALLFRAGADHFENLVVEHYMHLVGNRTPQFRDIDPAQIPLNIMVNGLGALASSGVGIDRFAVELGAGDLLLLCSRRLDIPDEEAARIARTALDDGVPLHELARAIERRAAMTPSPSDVAFAIALARPIEAPPSR
ncbi:hypothetical protein [Polyangium sorediatum]|uniref:Uncharacterized protein n=1 Tax=Polyangium sorediatum TaxID=889274 RepID=A0ABT6NSU4_9BACT|nr:hypothetical protein [Polyangium sorediatum]MDI1431404.1 hypothetical protein [Polyangium sorediatum]